MPHVHDKFQGVITCVCARCCETFLRSGKDVPGNIRNERITTNLIMKCMMENNYRSIIPRSKLDRISLINNLCDNCIVDMGLARFFK